MFRIVPVLALASSIFLASCGGTVAITGMTVTPSPAQPGSVVTISVVSTTSDSTPVSYSWTLPSDWKPVGSTDGAAVVLQAPTTRGRTDTVRVVVTSGGVTRVGVAAVSTVSAPVITNVLATPPTATVGLPVTLQAFSDLGTDTTVTFRWSLLQVPIGSRATLTGADTATPSLTPDVSGAYVYSVVATTADGAASVPYIGNVSTYATSSGIPQASLPPARSGDRQHAVAGKVLPQPIFFRVLGLDGTTPLRGVSVTAFVTNGTPVQSSLASDENGDVAVAVVTGTRAGPGSVTVGLFGASWVTAQPASFTVDPDKASALAVGVAEGLTVDQNAAVTAQVVDAYGNPASNRSDFAGGRVTLAVSSPSSNAHLESTGLTLDTDGRAVTTLSDSSVESVTLTASATPRSAVSSLTLATWRTTAISSCPADTGQLGWKVALDQVNAAGYYAACGSNLSPAEVTQAVSRSSTLSISGPGQLKFDYQAVLPRAAPDPTRNCVPQAAAYLVNSAGAVVAPQNGYATTNVCPNGSRFSLSAATAWTSATFDVTGTSVALVLSGAADILPGDSGASFVVSNMRLTTLASSGSLSVAVGPGTPALLKLTSTNANSSCSGGNTDATVTIQETDTHGNPVPDAPLVALSWPTTSVVSTGIRSGGPLVSSSTGQMRFRLSGGAATIAFSSTTSQNVTFTLDSFPATLTVLGTGSIAATVGGGVLCHSDGLGDAFSDPSPLGSQEAALAACNYYYSHHGSVSPNCQTNGSYVYNASLSSCSSGQFVWHFTATSFSGACSYTVSRNAGAVDQVEWMNGCSCGGTAGPNSAYYAYNANYSTWY